MLTTANIGSLLRALFAAFGGGLISQGIVSEEDFEKFIGAAGILISVLWSLYNNWKKHKDAAADIQDQSGAAGLVMMLLVLIAGGSLNAANSGGVASLKEAIADVKSSVKTAQPVDYRKMND